MYIDVVYTKKIDRCYQQCPHFSLDGGPSPAMCCAHPDNKAMEEQFIISHPECDRGFPSKCPLLKDESVRAEYNKSLEKPCDHNRRLRYTDGFQCEDKCGKYFHKDSPTYRKGEYLSSLWMALHNHNVYRYREGKEKDKAVLELRDRIGIGKSHDDYEALIKEAEELLSISSETQEIL